MNTTEVKIKYRIKNFSDLYKLAKKQFIDFEKVEGIDDWKEYNFSIDCAKDQLKFKDMLQIRFIEELTEATSALDNLDHFQEEMTDAVNFFLSAYIMADIDLSKLPYPELNKDKSEIELPSFKDCSTLFYKIIHEVGGLCNLLKNRPWTQSNYLVSLYDFQKRSEKLWTTFWTTIKELGISEKTIFELFERKYLVNQWRIRTGY